MKKEKVALITGSGFSAIHGLPITSKLSEEFLKTPVNGVLSGMKAGSNSHRGAEEKISHILQDFWRKVFGYRKDGLLPSMEDHFTMLDLAANSGHHLGRYYSPRKLRAIRRFSIHRTFQIINKHTHPKPSISDFVSRLRNNWDLSVVTLNWDIVFEQYLKSLGGFNYMIPVHHIDGGHILDSGAVPYLKCHGSSNWVYCDSCRRLFSDLDEKTALTRLVFLENADFRMFKNPSSTGLRFQTAGRKCPNCLNKLAGRVATFSYRKAFSIAQFQTIWDHAFKVLSEAERWLFVGYSMPEADFEFRHLLKSAQMGRQDRRKLNIRVVLLDDEEAANRYMSFFGLQKGKINLSGLEMYLKTVDSREFLGT